VSNGAIFVVIGIAIVVVIARKWDSFKWIFALGLVALALVTAFQMGMFDKHIPDIKTPTVDFK
jgi:1,4-dihydroxy-2-naphthoate octaprenyltransferase